MAKKGPRQLIAFICQKCGRHNYTSEKNKTNSPKKLVLKKFCKKCRKVTEHKETSKLK